MGVGWLHDFVWTSILGKDWSSNFVSLNFEFLLVHDEETWDCPKGKVLKKRDILKHMNFQGRVKGVVGTCSRKPYIMFWYTTDFICCFDFHFNKTWDSIIIWIMFLVI
jgi:hypothetical protein